MGIDMLFNSYVIPLGVCFRIAGAMTAAENLLAPKARVSTIALIIITSYLFCVSQSFASQFHDAVLNNNEEMLKKAIELKQNVDELDRYGETALGYAIVRGYSRLVKRILDYKVTLRGSGNKKYEDMVLISAGLGYADITKMLLDHGGDVSFKTKEGYTPLFMAVQLGNIETVLVIKKYLGKTKIDADMVQAIQRRLSYMGYYSSKIDGHLTSDTSVAIKKLQKALGKPANGLISEELYKDLENASRPELGRKPKRMMTNTYLRASILQNYYKWEPGIYRQSRIEFLADTRYVHVNSKLLPCVTKGGTLIRYVDFSKLNFKNKSNVVTMAIPGTGYNLNGHMRFGNLEINGCVTLLDAGFLIRDGSTVTLH